MSAHESLKHLFRGRRAIVVLVVLLVAGLAWEIYGDKAVRLSPVLSARAVEGIFFGRMLLPVEPSTTDPVEDMAKSKKRYRLMTIRRIPRIDTGARMPHPYVGDCRNCHLYIQGPGPGSQEITPVGVLIERLSRVHKVGPPLRPTARQPHPPAGRCIKCHDIVVKVPLEKKDNGFLWNL